MLKGLLLAFLLLASPALAQDGVVNPRSIQTKVITTSRDLTAVSGNVGYTGVGFMPTSCQFIAAIVGATGGSFGFIDSSKVSAAIYEFTDTAVWSHAGQVVGTSNIAGTASQFGSVLSYDADGFTLAWVKTGAPTGTLQIKVICSR